jgi:two-component system response regulator AtoC
MQPHKSEKTILIGEDELEARHYLEFAVRSHGYSVRSVRDGDEVLSSLRDSDTEFSAVLLDMGMPSRNGLDTLREIRAANRTLPVIIISGQSSMADTVTAMKAGATDYLCKPVTHEELGRVLAKVLETDNTVFKPLERENNLPVFFVGANPGVELRDRTARIGRSGAPVLIQGETGSGKEVLARELHAQSTRANKAFLKLNCAALPSELVESELFGYERGAFTGAFQKKAGMFELADEGTILLDEIGDMDVRLQAKLLQVLQDQEFRRVGGKETVKVDVRVIAATHRDLEKAIQEGKFREDLYYRLSVIVLHVPPLRDRGKEIIPLANLLVRKYVAENGPVPVITADLERALMSYHWPGNVRELENYMRKLVIFQDSHAIARELQMRTNRKGPASAAAPADNESNVVAIGRGDGISVLEQVTKVKQQAETEAILTALNSTRWNRKQAASILKIDYKSLLYKMKKLGIDDSTTSAPESLPTRIPEVRAANGD